MPPNDAGVEPRIVLEVPIRDSCPGDPVIGRQGRSITRPGPSVTAMIRAIQVPLRATPTGAGPSKQRGDRDGGDGPENECDAVS